MREVTVHSTRLGEYPYFDPSLPGGDGADNFGRGREAERTGHEYRSAKAARAIGVDETGKEFEAALSKIAPPKPRRS